MNLDLFGSELLPPCGPETIGECAVVLRGQALPYVGQLLDALKDIEAAAPFRHMVTPGGLRLAVALTNCGTLGWTSGRQGYRYVPIDPDSGLAWPPMPDVLMQLAREAAAQAGFQTFQPDACLVNRYLPGTRLSLHQDKNERDFTAPIVSISLGIPAIFLFGGHQRTDPARRVVLTHGDVAIWGGPDRLRYHGVLPLKHACHPLLGEQRISFTLRRAS